MAKVQDFAKDLAGLVSKYDMTLTSNEIITTLERALDDELALCGDVEASKARRLLTEALVLMRAKIAMIQTMSRGELEALRDHNAASWASQITDAIAAAEGR